MKIVQINSVYGTGSTGRIVKNIHSYLTQNRHKSYVFYGRGEEVQEKSVYKFTSSVNIAYHGLITRFFDKHGLASKNDTRKLVELLTDLNPDIIHLHNIHGYYLNYPLLFAYLKDNYSGKIYWTMHDCWAFTGHCAYYTYVDCQKWQTHCDKCPQVNAYPKSLYVDNSFENFELKKKSFNINNRLSLITPSRWLKMELEKSFLSNHQIITINNGIDKSVFKPQKSNLRSKFNLSNQFIILGVANYWDDRKGLNFFIELLDLLQNDEVIVVVGSSKFLNSFSHKKLIHIKQTNDTHELAKIYSASDVFVNPTLEDNYPTTNLEALACNTPIITFDTGGSPEAINDKFSDVVYEHSGVKLYESIKIVKNKIKKTPPQNLLESVTSIDEFVSNHLTTYHGTSY